MRPVCYLLLYFILFINSSVSAQAHYTLSGTVADEKGQPVKSATVFISGTEKITITDDAGRFTFYRIEAGTFTVSVSMLGYFPYAENILVKNSDVSVSITLQVKTTMLKEVVIGGNAKIRKLSYEVFKKAFLGTSANGKQCVILNPNVINFTNKKGVLLADADEFLIVENKNLGYRIKYLLKDFGYNFTIGLALYNGETVFEEMQGDEKMKRQWAKNRLETYKGSMMHFLRSVYNNKLLAEGYYARPIYSFVSIKDGRTNKLKYLNRVIVDTRPVLLDTLVTTIDTSFKSLKFKPLYVLYDPKALAKVKFDYQTPLDLKSVELDNKNGTIMKLYLKEAVIDQKGSFTDYRAFYVEGAFGRRRVGDQLPVEYQPPAELSK
jgi:hypothetical protein